MSQVVVLSTDAGKLYANPSDKFELADGTTVTGDALKAGDTFVITRDQANLKETITAVEVVDSLKLLASQDYRLSTVEQALQSNNDALLNLQRTIVELSAAHIDRIFTDPVMVDTLAQRFFIAGANAIAHKARTSKERTPQLVVIEAEIPGAIRTTLLEDGGVLIEEQLADTGEWVSGDKLSEVMQSQAITESFGNLLAGYGAEIGRAYYVVEDVYLEQFRKDAALAARQATAQVAGAAKPVAEDAPAESVASVAEQAVSEAPVVH